MTEPKPPPEMTDDRETRYNRGLSTANLDKMFAGVARRTVDRKPNALDRIRELPTRNRVALAAGLMLVCATVAILLHGGTRHDLYGADLVRFISVTVATFAVAVVAVSVALRGLASRPLGLVATALGGVAVALPLVLGALPGLWTGVHLPPGAPMAVHVGCLLFGLVVASLAAGSVLALSRASRPLPWRLLAAGGAGGIVGFCTMQISCPAIDLGHVLATHAASGLLISAVLVAGGLLVRALPRAS